MSISISSHATDSEEFDLRRNYQEAIGCLLECQSTIDSLQKQLTSKDETIASLEDRIVQMSLELASLKAFEDVHLSKRRVVSNVEFTDDRGDNCSSDGGSYDCGNDCGYRCSDGDRSRRRPPSHGTHPKPFVARSSTTMDTSFIDTSMRSIDIKRDLSLRSTSWDSPDYPAFIASAVEAREGSFIDSDECPAGSISLENSIPREFEVHHVVRHSREIFNWDHATQETERSDITGETIDARNSNLGDYNSLWQSCVKLQEQIRRSSFYLEQVMVDEAKHQESGSVSNIDAVY